jgi:hypothetical protein
MITVHEMDLPQIARAIDCENADTRWPLPLL